MYVPKSALKNVMRGLMFDPQNVTQHCHKRGGVDSTVGDLTVVFGMSGMTAVVVCCVLQRYKAETLI